MNNDNPNIDEETQRILDKSLDVHIGCAKVLDDPVFIFTVEKLEAELLEDFKNTVMGDKEALAVVHYRYDALRSVITSLREGMNEYSQLQQDINLQNDVY